MKLHIYMKCETTSFIMAEIQYMKLHIYTKYELAEIHFLTIIVYLILFCITTKQDFFSVTCDIILAFYSKFFESFINGKVRMLVVKCVYQIVCS